MSAAGRMIFAVWAAFVAFIVEGGALNAQPPGGRAPATYQRQSSHWRNHGPGRRHDGFLPSWRRPHEASSSWFQRPYPYHLDYYRMKYGGTYAPYFGNLYGTPFGTPGVVYGGWGPGAAGWGPEPGVMPQGVDGPVWVPYALPQGDVIQQPEGTSQQRGTVQQGSESLPAPTK